MFSNDKRIRIITGYYGSGKTEFALNYAAALSKVSSHVVIADLDIVNVYFRSREKRAYLENLGIHVISSLVEQNNCDIPALSPAIITPVKHKEYQYIIDLGGGSIGAVVLAQIRPHLNEKETDLFMVINTNRPETSDKESILYQIKMLEAETKLSITGLINNTNLIRESTFENIKEGEALLLEISSITQIPIRYTTFIPQALDTIPTGCAGELMEMQFLMRADWL